MADIGGITELELLEQDAVILKKQLDGVQGAESTSISCARIAAAIQKAEDVDGFLVKEGSDEINQFHTSEPAAEEKCCVLL
jgi:hypothetical protein